MRIGATAVGIVLFVAMACDRGRGGGISKDPAPRADAPRPVADADADPETDADAEPDADAGEPMPIEIHDSAAPKTSGPIHASFADRDSFARAVSDPFGACFHDARLRDPMLAGVVVVRFAVLSNGKIDAPAAGGKTLRDADLLDCLVVQLKRLELAPPPTSKEILSYTLAFR